MVLYSQVQTPLDLQVQHALTTCAVYQSPLFFQAPGERAEAWKADNAWPHPHETVRAKGQSARTRQKPGAPSPE